VNSNLLRLIDDVHRLDDEALLRGLRASQSRSCVLLAELMVQLGEVDARKLYADQGASSMHVYCSTQLGLSGGAAYKRIGVARAGRRFRCWWSWSAPGGCTCRGRLWWCLT